MDQGEIILISQNALPVNFFKLLFSKFFLFNSIQFNSTQFNSIQFTLFGIQQLDWTKQIKVLQSTPTAGMKNI